MVAAAVLFRGQAALRARLALEGPVHVVSAGRFLQRSAPNVGHARFARMRAAVLEAVLERAGSTHHGWLRAPQEIRGRQLQVPAIWPRALAVVFVGVERADPAVLGDVVGSVVVGAVALQKP